MNKWTTALSWFAVAACVHATVIVNDNFSTYSGYLNGNGNWVAGNDWTNVTGGVTAPDFKRAYYNQAINLAAGDSVTVTIDNYFTQTAKNGNLLRFGLRGDAALDNVADAYNFGRVEVRVDGEYRVYGDGTLTTAGDASVILPADNGVLPLPGTSDNLRLVWTIAKTATTDIFDVTAQAFNVTSNTAAPLWSGSISNAAMYADTSLYFGMDSVNATAKGKSFVIQNVKVEVIPEPATLGLIASCGAGLLFIRRRVMM